MARTLLDSEGRVTIPKEVRDRLQLEEGADFEVEIEGDTIKLHCGRPELKRVRADRDWGEEAFPDAGEALFGETQKDDSRIDVTVPSDPVDAIAGMLDVDSDSVSLQESFGERRRHRFDAKRCRDENRP